MKEIELFRRFFSIKRKNIIEFELIIVLKKDLKKWKHGFRMENINFLSRLIISSSQTYINIFVLIKRVKDREMKRTIASKHVLRITVEVESIFIEIRNENN
uniref:Uncharacterized protein n=1 Tax=Romanomermis culicivorax TaxID=13658 RepID=A0A915L733_ROMCU